MIKWKKHEKNGSANGWKNWWKSDESNGWGSAQLLGAPNVDLTHIGRVSNALIRRSWNVPNTSKNREKIMSISSCFCKRKKTCKKSWNKSFQNRFHVILCKKSVPPWPLLNGPAWPVALWPPGPNFLITGAKMGGGKSWQAVVAKYTRIFESSINIIIYIYSYINYLWNLDAFRTSHQGYEFRSVNPWCATVLKHWNTGFVDAEITWVGHKPTANHNASPPSQNGLRTVPRPSQHHSIWNLKPPMFEGSQAGDRTALDIPSTHEFSSGKKNLRSHKSSLNVVLCRSWRIFDIFGWTRSEQSIGKQRQTAHGTVPGAQTGTDFAWKVPGSKHWWHERPAVLWIATKNITSLSSSCLIHFVMITQDKDVDV